MKAECEEHVQVRKALESQQGIREQKMFGGICFLHHGNMLCGLDNNLRLMIRVGPNQYERVLQMKHARKMDFTGRPMKGFIFVDPEGWKTTRGLHKWLTLGLSFTATLPKKRKKP